MPTSRSSIARSGWRRGRRPTLRVIEDVAVVLALQRQLAAVQPDHGIKCRTVERGRDTSWDVHDGGVIPHLHARVQRDVHHDRRITLDPRRPVSRPVVASVCPEQRIVWVRLEALLRVLGRDRAGLDAVARAACPSVAAKGFLFEELLALRHRRADRGARRSLSGYVDDCPREQRRQRGKQIRGFHSVSPIKWLPTVLTSVAGEPNGYARAQAN